MGRKGDIAKIDDKLYSRSCIVDYTTFPSVRRFSHFVKRALFEERIMPISLTKSRFSSIVEPMV